jgi:hypothetical protein
MLKLFKREVAQELFKHPPVQKDVFSELDLTGLPESVQRYFHVCGWVGKSKMSNASIAIKDMQLKMDMDKDFIPVRSYQFNSVVTPVRIAYMKASMFGFIAFCGRDKYQEEGHMYISLMNLFPVAKLKGPEMDRSALVTVLAETFIAPSYALQSYIKWQSIDNKTASAMLTHNNTSVSGVFHFSDNGELKCFETADRYMTRKDGSMKQARWVAQLSNYQEKAGVRIATEMSACWEVDGNLKQYAQMKIADVRYDIHSVDEVLFDQ